MRQKPALTVTKPMDNPLWFFAFVFLITFVYSYWSKKKFFDAVSKSKPNNISTVTIRYSKKRFQYFWPERFTHVGDVIFTEDCIFVVIYYRLPIIRVYLKSFTICIDKHVAPGSLGRHLLWTDKVFGLDFMKINGRNLTLEFRLTHKDNIYAEYQMELFDIRDYAAYKQLLAFQRNWYEHTRAQENH